ncbi:MAG TPA: pyrroline-5-carboxylate reductase [Firmicutes bacterium]|jgi:pyrroline-5-carboxylate reductase|nr:pyrroline-5-carboxylate reductase [Bacillota bacterium]
MNKLGIVGGGAMGSALLKGIIDRGLFNPADVFMVETDPAKRDSLKTAYQINVTGDLEQMVANCQTFILAVKPNIVPRVLKELAAGVDGRFLVISIAAGISLTTLEDKLSEARVIRVMPNTPARIGKGISAYTLGKNATDEDDQQVKSILGCIGKAIKLPEHLLDAVTAVSGSGPAYVFYFLEAMIDAAVMIGLSRADATVLVTETALGSVELMRTTAEDPAKLRNDVTSPGGTTAAALYELQQGGCAGVIMKAIAAAAQKSKELGRSNG